VAITFVNAGTAAATDGTSLAPGYPADMQENDLLILQVGLTDTSDGDTTVTAPADPWKPIVTAEGESVDGKQALFYRRVPAEGLSGTLTVTVATPDTNDAVYARMYAWRGVHLTTPFENGNIGTLVFEDTFTDTNGTELPSHTPNTGTSWTEVIDTVGTASAQIQSNMCKASGEITSHGLLLVEAPAPSSPNMAVEFEIGLINESGSGGDDNVGVPIRYQDTNNYYGMWIGGLSSGSYRARTVEKAAGTVTTKATVNLAALTIGDIFRIEMIGNRFKVYQNGVEIEGLSFIDTSITAAGASGLGWGTVLDAFTGSDISALWGIDNFKVYTTAGPIQTGSGTTVTMPTVTTLGADRVAVAFIMVGSETTMASATGESGGDWTETVAEAASGTGADGTLQVQSAAMASAGTISGGTVTVTTGGWVARGFALVPAVTQNQYDETNRVVTITANISKTEQVDFNQLNLSIVIVSQISEFDSRYYSDVDLNITIVSDIIRTEQADFNDLSHQIVIESQLAEIDSADYNAHDLFVGIQSIINHVEQVDFKETEKLITSIAVISETDSQGAINYDETDRLVTIISVINHAEQVDYKDLARALTFAAGIQESDRADYNTPSSVTASTLLESQDTAAFNEDKSIAASVVIDRTDRADYTESKSIQIIAVTTEEDSVGANDYDETDRLLIITALVNTQERSGFNEITGLVVTSIFEKTDRTTSYEADRTIILDSEVAVIDMAGWVETNLQLNIITGITSIPKTVLDLPLSYQIKDTRRRAALNATDTTVEVKDTRTWQ
jgi:hypothetical protein